MNGERLMTDHVVSAWEGGWDSGSPGRVLLDHQARAPGAIGNGTANETGLVDLKPVERCWVRARAVAIAILFK